MEMVRYLVGILGHIMASAYIQVQQQETQKIRICDNLDETSSHVVCSPVE